MNPLHRVADWANDSAPPGTDANRSGPRVTVADFDVESFIEGHHLKVRRRGEWRGGQKWELECCPINPEHKGGCAVITKAPDGALGFKCHHNSCAGIGWTQLRRRLEPGTWTARRVYEAEKSLVQDAGRHYS
jgi:hypothetical protein